MPSICNLCDTIRPTGGTRLLVLNEGKKNYTQIHIEFCQVCGEKIKMKNEETGEENTLSELYEKGIEENDSHEKEDQFNSDAEADADALSSAGFGTDEDYGGDASERL